MNITYIIGNGFDLNNGFETSYNDYYTYLNKNINKYHEIEDIIKSINEFKSGIGDISWSDFEEGLLNYFNTGNITDVNIVKSKMNICINSLLSFLSIENKKLKNFRVNLQPEDNIFNPCNACEFEDKKIIMRKIGDNNPNNINIINLNYTDICNYYFRGMGCNIINIHGRINTSLTVLGADNYEQISNDKWNDSDISYLAEFFCKTDLIKEHLSETYNDCEKIIANTNLFVIFGTSMGITDESLWKSIGKSLNNGGYLIYSSFKEYVNPSNTIEYIDFLKEKRKTICDKLFLDEKFKNNIFIINSEKLFEKKLYYIDKTKMQLI